MSEPSLNQKKRDRNTAILWSRQVLNSPDEYVILDTETTGLGSSDEIVQIAIINTTNQVLLDTLVQVQMSIPRAASDIHGITKKHLKDAPFIEDILDQIRSILERKTVIAYNAAFDGRMLQQSIGKIKGKKRTFHGRFNCAMETYSMFVGEWNHQKRSYRWHKLKSGDHSALGDCIATLNLIREMAEAPLVDVKDRTWREILWEFTCAKPFLALIIGFVVILVSSVFLSTLWK